MNAQILNRLLHNKIPIAQDLKYQLTQITFDEACGQLDLQKNINHKSTMFGGSIYSGCALTAYSLFLYGLNKENFNTENIVISDGKIKYIKPVDKNAQFIAHWPNEHERRQFFKTLLDKNKARISIKVQVYVEQNLCCEFVGDFVAINTN